MDIRYITGDEKGWLLARKPTGVQIELPEYLKVEFIKTEKDAARNETRDHFKNLEGRERGTSVSVRQKPGGGSWLVKGDPGWRGAAQVRFSLSKKELTYPGGPKLIAVSEGGPHVPVGTHDLELPDVSHKFGEHYLGVAKRAKSWFFIGHSMNGAGINNRYLHVGNFSAGCVTVQSREGWDQLYRYLILTRKGDGKSVGAITVAP